MTTTVLTGTYSAGYDLQAPTTILSLTASGYIGGQGLSTTFAPTASYHVVNDGRIEAAAYLEGDGVVLGHGGGLVNGAASDTSAVVSGFDGVDISGGGGKVKNFATIVGVYGNGVSLSGGGSVANGSGSDATARIDAYEFGVRVSGKAGTVSNFGTIATTAGYGQQQAAVYLLAGGLITNGSNNDTSALISGYHAVRVQSGGSATVNNFGTLEGSAVRYTPAVEMAFGGVLSNGDNSDLRAQIRGGVGTQGGPLTLSNFGRIVGYDRNDGVVLGDGGSVTNGSSIATHAFIQGAIGLAGGIGAETVVNFGTIWGRTGDAVYFTRDGLGKLVVEAGSAFVGGAYGGGGLLDLANGVGTITAGKGTLSASDGFAVSGSMARSSFSGFPTVDIAAAAAFDAPAVSLLAKGLTFDVAGTLTLSASADSIVNAGVLETNGSGVTILDGALLNNGALQVDAGTLRVSGAASGGGTATIGKGTLDLNGAASQDVKFSGPGGVLELGDSTGYAGAVTGFSGAGKTSLDLDDIAFTGPTEATFSGTATSGVLTVTDGTNTAAITLEGNYRRTNFIAADNGHGGVIVTGSSGTGGPPREPNLGFIAAAAALGAWHGDAVSHHGPPTPRETWLAAPHAVQA